MDKNIAPVLIIGVLFTLFFIYAIYQLGDNGRWIRDYGIFASGISDNEVKGIWCSNNGFDYHYFNIDGEDYCGNIKVKMDCRFTNKGDYCIINKIESQNG